MGEVAERALSEGAGEGPGGYALAGPDAGQLREEFGAVDVLFQGLAEKVAQLKEHYPEVEVELRAEDQVSLGLKPLVRRA